VIDGRPPSYLHHPSNLKKEKGERKNNNLIND
jgi:hypothetical protein